VRLVPLAAVLTFVALLHCGDDRDDLIECTAGPTGKTCDCTTGKEQLGFCSPEILGIPSVCCAEDGWPSKGKHCTCDLVVCVSTAGGACKCSRSTERLQPPTGVAADEVAECPNVTSDTTRCCIDKAGNCGCYLKTADQCGEGATDVDKCDYFKAAPPCATGTHSVTTCEH
jgi:hypothetical protein